jgi:hypothetical protein
MNTGHLSFKKRWLSAELKKAAVAQLIEQFRRHVEGSY